MAIINTRLQGSGTVFHYTGEDGSKQSRTCGIYEGIVESPEDLSDARTASFTPGSLMFCIADGGVYVKGSDGIWKDVTL